MLSISFKVDEDDEPEASVGTVIEWTGNNPTVKRVKKRQKSRRGRGQRTVERTE